MKKYIKMRSVGTGDTGVSLRLYAKSLFQVSENKESTNNNLTYVGIIMVPIMILLLTIILVVLLCTIHQICCCNGLDSSSTVPFYRRTPMADTARGPQQTTNFRQTWRLSLTRITNPSDGADYVTLVLPPRHVEEQHENTAHEQQLAGGVNRDASYVDMAQNAHNTSSEPALQREEDTRVGQPTPAAAARRYYSEQDLNNTNSPSEENEIVAGSKDNIARQHDNVSRLDEPQNGTDNPITRYPRISNIQRLLRARRMAYRRFQDRERNRVMVRPTPRPIIENNDNIYNTDNSNESEEVTRYNIQRAGLYEHHDEVDDWAPESY